MRSGARLAAAMAILHRIDATGRPADEVLKAWGRENRYAGSGDRRRIGETVFAVLRRRAEWAWHMASDAPRALVLARERGETGLSADDLAALCDGSPHSPPPLTREETARLSTPWQDAPPAVRANLPDWLEGRFDPRFDPLEGGWAMVDRAPLDLRVNTARASRDTVRASLEEALSGQEIQVVPTPLSPAGLRLVPAQGRTVDVEKLPPFQDGLAEVQDEGSQIVSLLAAAGLSDDGGLNPGASRDGEPPLTVIDLCAGAGGKTLALASILGPNANLMACDTAGGRLAETRRRVARSRLAAVETRRLTPWHPPRCGGDRPKSGDDRPKSGGEADPDLEDWAGRADLVLLDVPCSGSGTWRRAPEAKWRLRPDWLDEVNAIQAGLLARGSRLVRPGGRLVYITCSMLGAENLDRTRQFLETAREFVPESPSDLWRSALGGDAPLDSRLILEDSLLLAPHLSGTDGFYFTSFRRRD